MLIVSQDGEKPVNYDNVNMIIVRENKIISFDNTYTDAQDGDLLGIYKDKERAKEVFEEIIRQYSVFKEIKALGGLDARRFIERQSYYRFDIYKMPKE